MISPYDTVNSLKVKYTHLVMTYNITINVNTSARLYITHIIYNDLSTLTHWTALQMHLKQRDSLKQ